MAKIKIRYSMNGTAANPTGLTAGELAINIPQRRVFIGDTGNNTVELAGLSANNFTGLNTFTAGISAAGGVTFAGSLSGTTATFSRLITAVQGISARGISLTGPGGGGRIDGLSFMNCFHSAGGLQVYLSLQPSVSSIVTNSRTFSIGDINQNYDVPGVCGGVLAILNGRESDGYLGKYGYIGYDGFLTNTRNYYLPDATGTFALLQNPQTFTALQSFSSGVSAAGATLSGSVTAPTPSPGTNNTQVATTAFVQTAVGSSTNVVTSFNGRTGAVQGVSAAVAGSGISVSPSGGTGTVTITSVGVGDTGAVQFRHSGGLCGSAMQISGRVGGVTLDSQTEILQFGLNKGTQKQKGNAEAIGLRIIRGYAASPNSYTSPYGGAGGLGDEGGGIGLVATGEGSISGESGEDDAEVSHFYVMTKPAGVNNEFGSSIQLRPGGEPGILVRTANGIGDPYSAQIYPPLFVNNTLNGTTAAFSRLVTFNQGISAAGGVTLAGSLSGTTAAFSRLVTFNQGISAAGGVTLAGNLSGTTAAFSRLVTASAGISAAGGVTLHNANLTGIPTAPTAAVGTNTTQIATTAFVNAEIAADAVTSFNGRTGAVQGVSAMNGLTGSVTFTGGQGITNANGSGNSIVPRINYRFSGLTFFGDPDPLPLFDYNISIATNKDYLLLQAHPDNPYIENLTGVTNCMYLTNLFSLKDWILNGGIAPFSGGSGGLFLRGVTFGGLVDFYRSVFFYYPANFLSGFSADGTITLNGTVTGRTASFSSVVTLSGGLSAAGGITLGSPSLTGTPTAPTAALGTNTTQIATTAFVQNEIVADAVTSFNGRTGAVQGVSAAIAGNGITVSGTTGAVTITNAGVTRAVAGTGISVSANTGTVTISNTGVVSFNGNAGAVTGASLGANTFTGLQTSASGFSGPLTGNATSATTATNSTQLGGVAAASYAQLASPTFTGTPAAPTATSGTNTTQIATTQFVRTEITNLVNSAPAALDTLNELALALGNDANFSTTIANSLGNKAGTTGGGASGTWGISITGNAATATSATTATNSTQLGGVAAASYAQLASPTFTGTPASTTAAVGTNTTQIATTAFVQNEIIADTVTAFNGRTGSVQGVSAAVAGSGISVSAATGSVTISNTGVLSFNGNAGAVIGASLGANAFTGLQTSATGFSGPLTGNATSATNASQLGGVAAASYALLASPTFTGTPASTTAAVGTNTTQIATTAFVQNEIVADTVTAFNGRTGAVQGVSAAVAGSGISVSAATGSVTISNTGVLSFNGAVGAVTGASLGANTFTGLQTSATGFSGPLTGNATSATNSTQLGGVAAANYAQLASPTFTGTPASTTAAVGTNTTQIATTAFVQNEIIADTVTAFNGRTGSVQGVSAAVAGSGISVSAATGSVTISNTGVLSFNGNAGAVTGASLGANTFTGLQTSATGFSGPLTGAITGNATTATTLQTARSINGTAFNGSADITTANWGTTRDITIGSTTRSVNGSGNYSWSITDIGAVGTGTANTFTALQTFTGGISAAAGITLVSPSLTGTPTAPTATSGTNTTQVATTQFVRTEITNLVNAAPAALDTLNELAAALGNDANFSTTITNSLANKAGTTGGNASGTWGISITGNAATATNSTQLGGTAAASWALLASPTFTGTPASTTAAVGTNTTQIATTAFVNAEIAADAVTAFNGRTGSVQGVSAAVAGDGITVSGATGAVTITNAGVTRAVAGTGISVNANTGTVTITNSGVTSLAAGTGVAVSASTGAVTVTNIGVQSFNGATGAVTGASLGANTFTGLQTSATGFSGPLTGNATSATNSTQLGGVAAANYARVDTANTFTGLQTSASGFSGPLTGNATTATNSTQLGGVAAASYALLASPTFTGTPASTTAAVGTNTTQIATTAFVQNEIIADTVTSFNGRTGAVQGVSAAVAGNGISVSGATGAVTITNTGVTRAVAGTGISVNANTGTVTITNSGVLSFNGNAGAVTGASLGANTFTGLQTSATGFSGPLTGNATTATTATNSTQLGGTAAASWAQLAAANTFTALNTFNSGIKSNVYEPLTGGAGVTIGSLSGGGSGTVHVLSSEMRIGGTGTLQGVTLATLSGVTMTVRPRHNLIVSAIGTITIQPQVSSVGVGSMPSVLIQNTDNGSGQIRISGGNLYLGTRYNGVADISSDIIFGNPNNAFTTTLTAPNTSTSNKTITLPNESGTVALETKSNARGWFM